MVPTLSTPLFLFSRAAAGRSGHWVAFRASCGDARPTEVCQVGGALDASLPYPKPGALRVSRRRRRARCAPSSRRDQTAESRTARCCPPATQPVTCESRLGGAPGTLADSAGAGLLVWPPYPAGAAARSAGTTAAWTARGDRQGEGRPTRALRLRSPLPQPPPQALREWRTARDHQDACLDPGTGPPREA